MADAPSVALIDVLKRARQALTEAGIEDAALDARLIVEHFTDTTQAHAVISPQRPVEKETVERIEAAIDRRAAGEPAHRIIGIRDFYGLPLTLSRATLEPRPDTETLVDAVLPFVRRTARETGVCRILDLGTGTGAVALALLSQEPRAIATATDISPEALATATANAEALGLKDRFFPVESDWFAGLRGTWEAIVSNPPYIAWAALGGLSREVRDHDPMTALDGGPDGLDAYRAIARGAPPHMAPAGILALEIGFNLREAVSALLKEQGFGAVECFRDLAGHDRVVSVKARA